MNDDERILLEDHLDGRLGPLDEARVALLLERDDEARTFVHEHRAVWDALGEAFGDELEDTREGFAEATVAAALRDRPRRGVPLGLAAALIVAIGIFAWTRTAPGPEPLVRPADEEVVRHLHVLRDLELIETHAEALDLRLRWDVLTAFEGEQEGEG